MCVCVCVCVRVLKYSYTCVYINICMYVCMYGWMDGWMDGLYRCVCAHMLNICLGGGALFTLLWNILQPHDSKWCHFCSSISPARSNTRADLRLDNKGATRDPRRAMGYSQEKLFINDITTSWVLNRSGLNERKMGIEPFGAVLFNIQSRAHTHTRSGCVWMYPFISRIYLTGDGDRSAPRSWAQALVIAWELFWTSIQ